MFKTQEEWIGLYQEERSSWSHDGNMKRPHIFLPFPLMGHSNGFFSNGFIMENPRLLDEAISDLVELLTAYEARIINTVDRVVGLGVSAGLLAHGIARCIGQRRSHDCLCSIARMKTDGHRTTAEFVQPLRMTESVLMVSDLFTGGSIGLLTEAVAVAGGYPISVVAALANCFGTFGTESGNRKNTTEVVALINCPPIQTWTPSECPLCKEGSEAILPKGKENWERLNAPY